MFRAHVLIVRRAKLYYRASGIITPIGGLPVHRLREFIILSQPVHGTATYRCDDTRDCIIQFCPLTMSTWCSKHVEAWNKLIIKFIASSWLILVNKYIEMHGQQNIRFINSFAITFLHPQRILLRNLWENFGCYWVKGSCFKTCELRWTTTGRKQSVKHGRVWRIVLTFMWPCIVMNSYNKNQPDALISQIYFWDKFYTFRTVPLSIIRSFSLYTQQWCMS